MTRPGVTSWSLDLSLPDWLEVPTEPFDIDLWRASVTDVFELLVTFDAQLDRAIILPGPLLDVSAALDLLLEFSRSLPTGVHLVAGLTVPGRWPLPVIVEVSETAEDPVDLLDTVGARSDDAIELPIVEYLPDHLGDGIRVTRFDLDEGGVLWATVTCARRGDGADTVLTWRTTDLELVALFSADLETLMEGVRIGVNA